MTDRELRKEFVRVEKTQDEVQILVHEIRWQGPHTPIRVLACAASLGDHDALRGTPICGAISAFKRALIA